MRAVYLVLATIGVAAWILALTDLSAHVGKPFPGFYVEHNLDVSTARPADWNGSKAFEAYDVLVSANGQVLHTPADLDDKVASVPVGTPITYTFLRRGQVRHAVVPTQRLDWPRALEADAMPLVGSFLFLLTGIAVFALRPNSTAAQAHLMMTLAVSGTFSGCEIMYHSHRFAPLFLVWTWLLGAGFFHLGMVFPTQLVARRPWLAALPYAPVAAFAVLVVAFYRPVGQAADPRMVAFYLGQLQAYALFSLAGLLFFVGNILYSAFRGHSPSARNQAQLVLLGTVAGFAPLLFAYLLPVVLGQGLSQLQIIVEALAFNFFPLIIAYAIVRHQLFDIQLVIRRATLYLALTAGLAGIYLLAALAGYEVLSQVVPSANGPSVPGFVAALAVAVAFRPMHHRLGRAIDRLFLGDRVDAVRMLAEFGKRLTGGPRPLWPELLALIVRALGARWAILRKGDDVLAAAGSLPDDPAPGGGHSLALEGGEAPTVLQVGPKGSEMPYSAEETTLLEVVAGQARVALENVHLLEERVGLLVQEAVASRLAHERQQILMQVVHDLRCDLHNIALATQVARQAPDDQEAFESILRSVSRIEGFLLEKADWVKQKPPVAEIGAAVGSVVEVLGPRLAATRQTLVVKVPDRPARVPLTEVEIEQVLLNLLANASKFSPVGTNLELTARHAGDQLILEVRDHGPGIAPELMDKLGTGERAPGAGHGFGLQNVKALVEHCGGTLSWRNANPGAAFEVRLPLVEAPFRAPGAAPDPGAAGLSA